VQRTIFALSYWLAVSCSAAASPEQHGFDRAFSQAAQLCEHYFLPNSMAREPGFDIHAYLNSLDGRIEVLAKTFASSDGAAFVRAKAREADDDVAKRCAEKLLEESGTADARDRPGVIVDEMECGRFRATAFADHKAREFGVLLREYDPFGTEHPKLLRSYVFPETQAEFDFRVAPRSVYCELSGNSLSIYGRGYDEGGDVVFRVRLDTSSWKYDFSRVRVSENPN